MWGRSARGRARSLGPWTATRPSGAPPTRARSPAPGCGSAGTRARGPRTAPTRSSPRDGAEITRGWVDQLQALGFRPPVLDRPLPVILAGTPIGTHRPGPAGRSGSGPARCGPVGLERRRHPRRGRTSGRRRRRHRRRPGAGRAHRGPHQPRPRRLCAAADPRPTCPSTSGRSPRRRSSTSRPTSPPGSPTAPRHRSARATSGPPTPSTWTRASGRSPRPWSASTSCWWSRAPPAPGRPPPSRRSPGAWS